MDQTGVLGPTFDSTLIQRILPHRYPFLFVDRITEFKPDERITGIKNVTGSERYMTAGSDGVPVMPIAILTETVAQVGALLILGKPENEGKLIYFMGMTRVRFRQPPRAGEVLEVTASVKRLRAKMGLLVGTGYVGRRRVIHGIMTFALGA